MIWGYYKIAILAKMQYQNSWKNHFFFFRVQGDGHWAHGKEAQIDHLFRLKISFYLALVIMGVTIGKKSNNVKQYEYTVQEPNWIS